MFKRLSVIAAVFFLLTAFINPALAGTLFSEAKAIEDALQNYGGYYKPFSQNVPGQDQSLYYITSTGLSNLTDGNGYSYGFLTYGQPHGDQKDGQHRYIGYTFYGEAYTNMDFPADQNAEGADFTKQNWIREPWDNPDVRANNPQLEPFLGDGDPAYRTAILAGIMAYGATNANNGYTISETSNPAFWNEIEKRVHILSPATSRSWGIGRMWRYDESGNLWYVTVPIMPGALLPEPGNLKAVSIDLGVPPGHKAEPGTKYQARVTFENQSDKSFTEVPVAVLHGEYQAVLCDESSRPLPKKNVGGKEVQVADFGPGQSRTIRCDWHPWPQAKDGLTGVINRDEIGKVYSETTYEDNVVSAEVPVDFQNLRVEIIDHPAEVIEGETATVTARIFNESGQMVVTKVVWKVDGRVVKEVNDFDVISRADTVLTFTMPAHDVTVEVIVNPDRNAPPNESTYGDNSASCAVRSIPKRVESSGSLTINAPNPVYARHITKINEFYEDVGYDIPEDWNFTVRVITNIPRPRTGPDDPPPPPPVFVVKVNGQSQRAGGYHHEGYNLYGPVVNDNVRDVSYSDSTSYTAGWGRYEKTITFTFPKSGLYGYDKTVNLKATADCDYYDIHLSASKNITIKGLFTRDFSVKLTQ